MNVSYAQRNILLKYMPNVNLQRPALSRNMPSNYDFCKFIPKGPKYFLWFKKHNGMINSYFIKDDKSCTVLQYRVCFHHYLTNKKHGTLCYGTIVDIDKMKFFVVEDVYIHKGNFINNTNNINSISAISNLFKDIQQKAFTQNDCMIISPTICKATDLSSKQDYENIVHKIPYTLYGIEFTMKNGNRLLQRWEATEQSIRTFNVRARIQQDIYELYDHDVFHDIAFIPDYKTSVMLNREFRYIKENYNLDLLEESDDEDDFENTSPSKYVNVDKILAYKCQYNPKFKKWVPIEPNRE